MGMMVQFPSLPHIHITEMHVLRVDVWATSESIADTINSRGV